MFPLDSNSREGLWRVLSPRRSVHLCLRSVPIFEYTLGETKERLKVHIGVETNVWSHFKGRTGGEMEGSVGWLKMALEALVTSKNEVNAQTFDGLYRPLHRTSLRLKETFAKGL